MVSKGGKPGVGLAIRVDLANPSFLFFLRNLVKMALYVGIIQIPPPWGLGISRPPNGVRWASRQAAGAGSIAAIGARATPWDGWLQYIRGFPPAGLGEMGGKGGNP